MHRAQLIFLARQGPAMELLRLAQGCGWATAGWRPMPWRDGPLCCFSQLVRGNVLVVQVWPIDNSSIKTNTVCESDLHRIGWW